MANNHHNLKKLVPAAGFATLIVILLLGMSLFDRVTCSAGDEQDNSDKTLVYSTCNGERTFSGIFVDLAWSLMYDLTELTGQKGFDYYQAQTDYEQTTEVVYGHAACNGKLTSYGCSMCLSAASTHMCALVCQPEEVCASDIPIGAQVQLKDCRMRFETYAFIDN